LNVLPTKTQHVKGGLFGCSLLLISIAATNQMRKIKMVRPAVIVLFALFAALALIAGCGASDEESGTDKKVITLGKAPYDYEVPVIEVTKQILTERGYEVKVVEGDIGFMFLSLTNGDIDAWPGVWLPAIHRTYQEKYGDQYELGSAIFKDAPTGWVVPKYVQANSIEELKGNEKAVNGKLVGFEPGSGMMLVSEDVIKEYGLDLELVSGTLPSMLAEVDYAISQKEPIVFLGWRPHTMFRKYDLKVLEDPKGIWEIDSYYWGMNKQFKDKAPDAHKYMSEFQMSIDDIETYLDRVEKKEQTAEQLAKQWIDQNRSEIDRWLEGAQ